MSQVCDFVFGQRHDEMPSGVHGTPAEEEHAACSICTLPFLLPASLQRRQTFSSPCWKELRGASSRHCDHIYCSALFGSGLLEQEGCDLCSSGWYKPSNVTSWSVYYSSAVFQLKTAPLNILMSRWNVCNVTQTAANT